MRACQTSWSPLSGLTQEESGRKRRYRRIIGNVDGCRTAGGRWSSAPVSSAAQKKKAFDRGGSVWPPRSNAADRLGGVLGRLCPPSQKPGSLGGSAPQPKSEKIQILRTFIFFENFLKVLKVRTTLYCFVPIHDSGYIRLGVQLAAAAQWPHQAGTAAAGGVLKTKAV